MTRSWIAAVALAALTLAGCGTTGSGEPLTVGAAREAGGDVVVQGFLISDGETVRLCELILESYPPQCGGASLEVHGADVEALATEAEGEIRWAEDAVTLTGTVEGDRLTVTG